MKFKQHLVTPTLRLLIVAIASSMALASCSSNPDGMLSDDQKIEQAHKAHDSYMKGMSGKGGAGAPNSQPGASK